MLSNQSHQAVLHADIFGFSRLMDRDEAGTIVRVRKSLATIRDLVRDYGGSVQNTAGDAVLAVFPGAEEALRFAVEMQRELANEVAWSDGDDPILYRIGINTGHTVASEGELYGHAINTAARIQALARPGGICISESAYHAISENAGHSMRSLGRQSLKNISQPVEVYEVVLDSLPGAAETEALPQLTEELHAPDSSVAVLPLQNVTGDTADKHLCEGIVSDVISNLSRFRNLLVTARHSTFLVAARTLPTRDIGRQLGVRYLLSGNFHRIGDKIRITVDLVEAETANTIWSERYNGTMADIFDFLDDMTATTAARLAIQIDMAERRRFSGQNHPDLRAYGLVLRGQDLGFRFRPETNLHARRLFEEARNIDPRYGRTYAAISRTFNVEWRYNWTNDREAALNEALDLARRAVEKDDLDARGYSELGLAHLYKKQHDEALAAYERALELNPNDADLLAEMADCLVYVRQADRSVDLLERAIRLNPYHPDSYLWYLGDAYFQLGDYENTIETLRKMRDQSEGQRLLAASYALSGHVKEARHHANLVMEAHPNFSIENWRNVPPNKYPEDLEVFVEGLRLAGLR